jgi:hypothetical protein
MPFEPGDYRGRIVDYGVYQSTVGQQHPTVFVTFDVIGRYDPGTDELGSCPPGTRTYSKAITPKTIDWVLADLRAVGFDKDGFTYLDPEVPGAVNLFDREIDVVCDHESYDGSVRERWSIYREPARKRVARGDLEQLDAQFADKLRKAFGGAPQPAAPLTERNDTDETF